MKSAYFLLEIVAIVVIFCFFTACNNEQTMEPGNGNGLEATLASIQSNILSQRCAVAGCHVPGGLAPMPLRNADESFANLVNVASVQIPNLDRVEPGDPDNSYLIRKLEGAAGIVGTRMPQGGPFLSAEQIGVIREWIQNGAERE